MPSDAVVIAIASGFLAFLGILVNALVAYYVAKLNTQNKKSAVAAAVEVGEVKIKLEESTAAADKKLNKINETGNAVHILVNSNMGIQLQISAAALKRLAILTKDPEDEAAAAFAAAALKDHNLKQADVDSGKDAPNVRNPAN